MVATGWHIYTAYTALPDLLPLLILVSEPGFALKQHLKLGDCFGAWHQLQNGFTEVNFILVVQWLTSRSGNSPKRQLYGVHHTVISNKDHRHHKHSLPSSLQVRYTEQQVGNAASHVLTIVTDKWQWWPLMRKDSGCLHDTAAI